MKEKNEIDDLFKDRVERHYPVDENLWAQVESQLPSKQPPYSFFSLNGIFFIITIFCCSLIPKDNSYSQQYLPTLDSSVPKNYEQISLSNKENSSSETKTQINSLLSNKIDQKTSPNLKAVKNKLSSSSVQQQFTPEPSSRESQIANSYTTTPVNSESVENVDRSNKVEPKVLPSIALAEEEEEDQFTTYPSLISQTIPTIDLIDLTLFPYKEGFTPKSATELKRPKHKPTTQYYEVELFHNLLIQKNVSTNVPDIAFYKEETEEPLASYAVGINTVKQKKRFVYGLGVQLNQYTERVSYDIEKESTSFFTRTDTAYQVVNNQFNSNGIPILLIEQVLTETTIPTTVIVNDKLVATNTIKRIRIPAFVGYNYRFNNWSTEVRTALIPSVLFQSQGVTVQQNQDQIESLSSDNTERLLFSLNNQLRIGYAINESFAVGTSLYMENDLNSYSKEIDSKLNHQGIGIWFTIKP